MLEKWKQKAIQMNLRKAVIFFIVTSFVLILASSAAVYGNFHSRMNEWEKFMEADREHDGDFKEKRKIGKTSQKACICLREILRS